MIRGITVTLYEQKQIGVDALRAPVFEEMPVEVKNVLVGQPEASEALASTDLYGKRILYMLGIPKGDTHDWQDKKVEWTDAYGRTITVKTFGFPITGIEANIPGPWHMQVRCGAYE